MVGWPGEDKSPLAVGEYFERLAPDGQWELATVIEVGRHYFVGMTLQGPASFTWGFEGKTWRQPTGGE